ncbi:OB-fold nucleic acid binding domain-containing protein, partial [Streptomyces sp. URMC 129]|uniref:OB-fold nucleic acid binding domain-containing protein n=1 Tax=Streptomyces sp. URMC 129 TaxID=3423407 RepID=UPI003F1CF9DF
MGGVTALHEPLAKVVGGTTAKVMAAHLDLHTVGDLLHHYPRRYAERGELTRLTELPLDEHVTVVAEIADTRSVTFNRGSGVRLEVTITDGSGRLQLVFFGRRAVHHHEKVLLPGRRGMFAGKVTQFNRRLQLSHPAYELLDETDEADGGSAAVADFAGRPLPIYPAVKQLESWRIAKSVGVVLDSLAAVGWEGLVDPLPGALRARRGLIELPEAFEKVHRPRTKRDVADARARLKWDEAFVLQVALARRRAAAARLPAAPMEPVSSTTFVP